MNQIRRKKLADIKERIERISEELQEILNEEEEITLLIGSSNDREVALEKDIQFILASFPMSERLIFNRTYAGYRGGLTFTEDLYDNL